MDGSGSLVTPTNVPEIGVDRLRSGELDAAAKVLARSFVDEPLFAYLFAGHDAQAMSRAMTPWFRTWLRAYAPCGHVHTARRGNELIGVGIRMAPGDYPLGGVRRLVFTGRLVACVLRMGLTSRRAFRLFQCAGEFERREPREPFWHLAWVGVLPECRRMGVGSALADEVIRVIEAQPALAWVLTFGAHTRRIYERRGFVVEGELEPIAGGPVGWTMRRDPGSR